MSDYLFQPQRWNTIMFPQLDKHVTEHSIDLYAGMFFFFFLSRTHNKLVTVSVKRTVLEDATNCIFISCRLLLKQVVELHKQCVFY